MFMQTRPPWAIALVVGLVAVAASGAAPVRAQSVPVIVPPIAPIVVGISPGTPSIPSVVIGLPGKSGVHGRTGITWSTSGRADVDVDIDRHHGQAATR
jgi:hypothetical protein